MQIVFLPDYGSKKKDFIIKIFKNIKEYFGTSSEEVFQYFMALLYNIKIILSRFLPRKKNLSIK